MPSVHYSGHTFDLVTLLSAIVDQGNGVAASTNVRTGATDYTIVDNNDTGRRLTFTVPT